MPGKHHQGYTMRQIPGGSYRRDASGRLAGPGPRPPASGPPKLALLLLGAFWLVIGTLCVAAMYPNSNKFVAEEAAIVSHARRLLDDSATTTTTTTSSIVEPGDLIGSGSSAIGAGLFCLILFGALGIVGCAAADGTEHPGPLKFLVGLLYLVVVLIIFLTPKKVRGTDDPSDGQFTSDWLWYNAFAYIIMGVGLLLGIIGMLINVWNVPVYALDDDRMARKV